MSHAAAERVPFLKGEVGMGTRQGMRSAHWAAWRWLEFKLWSKATCCPTEEERVAPWGGNRICILLQEGQRHDGKRCKFLDEKARIFLRWRAFCVLNSGVVALVREQTAFSPGIDEHRAAEPEQHGCLCCYVQHQPVIPWACAELRLLK